MTADDPAGRPSAREVATALADLPTTASPVRTLAAESSTRVRTKPLIVAPTLPTQRPAPVRRSGRRRAVWLAAAGVLTTALMVAVLVWLLPRDGSNFELGPAPTASAGDNRLRQDLHDVQSVVQP
jgi:ferric-dicitrate binding protein FerR (iron transport regulator)